MKDRHTDYRQRLREKLKDLNVRHNVGLHMHRQAVVLDTHLVMASRVVLRGLLKEVKVEAAGHFLSVCLQAE